MKRRYTVLLEGPDENGWIVATFPAFRRCATQGRTREEALTNAREILEFTIEDMIERGESLPEEQVDTEIIEVAV